MEIGSEFWKIEKKELRSNNNDFFKFGIDTKFTFSGRTAIDYILQEIENTKKIKNVYFPSYACDSMLEPFLRHNIDVTFYNVYYENGLKYDIDLNQNCDIFFAMNYFGYSETNMEKYSKEFKKRGCIVLEDITHSIFSKANFGQSSDYLVGSLRKWLPVISGAIAINRNSKFLRGLKEPNKNLIHIKKNAMEMKKIYIDNGQRKEKLKEKFLSEYDNFNKELANNFENYRIDDESLEIIMKFDFEELKRIRNENVKCIYDELKNNKINFLIENYNQDDCLLFVPIILPEGKRDEIRSELISKKIYLPIHWNFKQNLSNIPKQELSLICDQRYNKKQIKSYLQILKGE